MKRDLSKPLAPTFGGPGDPKKKYTAKDSANYYAMLKRDSDDFKKLGDEIQKNWGTSKAAQDAKNRIALRSDSTSNNPYFKAKAKTTVKKANGKTTITKKL